jgi:hypothetical protein
MRMGKNVITIAATPTSAPPALIILPSISSTTGPMLTAITAALGAHRSILASDDEIQHAWTDLPRQLTRIPPEHRNETLLRMCVAVAAGLFDSAINYAWNAAVVELREKVRRFGLPVIKQAIGKLFDEDVLVELKDIELLQICLQLKLISEEGYFLLDQCRAVRNNFSAAHPSMGTPDGYEFLGLLNRVAKHALANEHNPRGVDIQGFITAVKAAQFTAAQAETWCGRIAQTFDAQREMLIGMLHGIYCDPISGEEARINALMICQSFTATMTPKTRSGLVDRHQDYRAKGDDTRYTASQQLFERLGLLALLGDAELHSIVTAACKTLISVHSGFNNFYNEPPFAERLAYLAAQNQVPDSARDEFVDTIMTCAVGNQYGASIGAYPSYTAMVKSFSPAEIEIMLNVPKAKSVVANRIRIHAGCKTRFENLVGLLSSSSVPTPVISAYEKWNPANA